MLLVGVAAAGSLWGKTGLATQNVVAAVRAALQLAAVSLIIVACLRNVWLALAFSLLMFAVAVRTTVKRTGTGGAWPWTALAMGCGVVPVLAIIFGTGASPFTGAALIPLAGIVIGNMMTAHTLFGRRQFAALRENIASYESALSLGFQRHEAVELVTQRTVQDALVPNLDTTRTVGLVTLPGAFVGVLLGGGSALQAGAAQLLVLVGIMAGQTLTVVIANKLMRSGRLLPADLRERLRP
ncbi:ABC transporter permease [Luteococcus sp. OSA5]|uniref:ABC transporter permease n=1 Tax=Luteococcus sp. OSA5 TaxID=3401630 RepID=UPI003B42BEFA